MKRKSGKDGDNEVEIVSVSKRKGKLIVEADSPVKTIRHRTFKLNNTAESHSADITPERVITIESLVRADDIDLKRGLTDDLEYSDKGRWEQSDAAMARALQEELNSSYQPLSFEQNELHLREIGVTDPELFQQLLGSGIYNEGNFADDNLDTSYEALLALGERIGDAKPKGLPNHVINRLISKIFSEKNSSLDDNQCVVCLTAYEDGEEMFGLPCCHLYIPPLIVVSTEIALSPG